ncbi:hypothetical protein ACLBXJ_02810 [Methylobacterium mesophilicum]|uniref:hypothetical protein n=1 Tax=Methylobacterium mesophilicum TaxID=39956 RepID=UPI001EE2DC26|nr:hypothetical protein [Methylobacterium mesophilicum]GJE21773.1 hypothetical protein JHFBIEKO_2221 [Methylobacterium mesophilicum]
MPTEIRIPHRGLQLQGLRACALYPQGMRHGVHPSVMPVLQDLGPVEEMPVRGPSGRKLWFLTQAGRELLTEIGMSEPRES